MAPAVGVAMIVKGVTLERTVSAAAAYNGAGSLKPAHAVPMQAIIGPAGIARRTRPRRSARIFGLVTFGVERIVPILRIFDQARARDFYVGYLGCSIDWEHRFDGQGPLYMQVSRGSLVLHLSEHHGDGAPGQVVYVAATGVRDLHAELQTKDYPFLNPGISPSPGDGGGGACLQLLDPFGNTLRIDERGGSRVTT